MQNLKKIYLMIFEIIIGKMCIGFIGEINILVDIFINRQTELFKNLDWGHYRLVEYDNKTKLKNSPKQFFLYYKISMKIAMFFLLEIIAPFPPK